MDEKDIYLINLQTNIRKISYENIFEKYLIPIPTNQVCVKELEHQSAILINKSYSLF